MDKTEPQKQTNMVTKSSVKRKPLADITNIIRKPYHTQSKKPVSSTASDSSIGSTQNPIVVLPELMSDRLAGEEKQTMQGQRCSSRNTSSKTTAAVPFYQASSQGRKNNVKEGSVSLCSSTSDKIKDQGKKINKSCLDKTIDDGKNKISVDKIKDQGKKINKSCLDKTIDDGKNKISVAHHNSSTEKITDKRKPVDVPSSALKNAHDSAEKVKGKENVVQDANSNMGIAVLDSLAKRKDKGKAIAEPPDYSSKKKLKNSIMEFSGPLKGVIIKEREGTVMGSGSVNPVQKDKGKGVSSTPLNYHTLEKKDQQSSCPPILRTMSNRSVADRKEDALNSKPQTEPPPNKKKRRYATKDVKEEYTLPKEFVEQQRAYFKEIDDFELQVEEV